MDAIQAAVVSIKLKRFEEWMHHRRDMAERYHEQLAGLDIDLPLEGPNVEHAYKLYTICVDERDELRRHLARRGIESGILYYPPLHMQTVYEELPYEEGDFPVSEDRCAKLVNLPMFNGLKAEQVDRIARAVIEFYE
jgi:dTDP-4-amino-4,6-dideoxygalactose transaminase